MPNRSAVIGREDERVALKDEYLVYRACSRAFARCLGADSPEAVIGKTDFDLLPKGVAREQMALDSRTMHLAQADIGTIELVGADGASCQSMIVRTPITTRDKKVRGIDIRLLGRVESGTEKTDAPIAMPSGAPPRDESRAAGSTPTGSPPLALPEETGPRTGRHDPTGEGLVARDPTGGRPVDLVTLVNDGIQGSLIFSGESILFANDNAAGVLGFAGTAQLIEEGRVSALLEPDELRRIAERTALDEQAIRGTNARESDAPIHDGRRDSGGGTPNGDAPGGKPSSEARRRRPSARLTLTAYTLDGRSVRLIARVAEVSWGPRRATLLSFVDVAMPSCDIPDIASMGESSLASRIDPEAAVARRLPDGDDSLVRLSIRDDHVESDPLADDRAEPDRAGVGSAERNSSASLRRLRVDEERFRHYASSASDFFWELDANLVFRVVSDDIEKVLGISGERLIGRTHWELSALLADASDPDHWQDHLDRLDRHEQFRDFEFHCTAGGDTRVIRYSGLPLFDKEGRFVGYRGVGGDVTAAVRQAEALAYHADHDGLTGLFNRRRFEAILTDALETPRTRQQSHALCFLDLDRFKVVNDTGGHPAGDELLRQLARLLDSLVRKSDVLARLGGDEFGVFLYECGVAGALKLANQIRSEVERFEFLWEGKRFTIGVSIGLVTVDDRWTGVEPLFSAADSACYIAKNEGRNRVVVHRDRKGARGGRRVATHWVEEINSALACDRLQLARQPIRSLGANAQANAGGAHMEMLLRLRLPDGGIVAPPAFLPAAERHGLSAALDERVVELTLDWLASLPDASRAVRHVSINLASGSFTDADFAERLMARVERSGVAAETLCFELSEIETIAHLAKAGEFMRRFASAGCRFGIDDFGSSLSSFNWMRELPIDFVKIDGRLVKAILDDPVDLTTVRAIGDISRSMGTRTVAESVESSDLLDAVREAGIDFAQGFHVGKPELIEGGEWQLTR